MSNRKKRNHLPPWASELCDGTDIRYIQIGNSLLLSKTFQELSNSAKQLYYCMMMESGGRPDYKFPKRSFTKYGLSTTTARRAIEELITNGFIYRTSLQNLRKPNEYHFTDKWKHK